jgi:hypothetical protein
MASTYSQLPGDLTLALVRGDEVSFSAVFAAVNLTGYTVMAAVYSGFGATATDTPVATPTVTVTTASSGGVTSSTVQISLTETQTLAISPTGTSRWYLRWVSPGGVTRTVLSGVVSAQNP